ncbi:MAG TPA: hypothetical protein VHI10_10025 [Mycobacterium sp.]|nr:hypothetical protein [Mycobacterium sp.]
MLLSLALLSCHADPPAKAQVRDFNLNEPFTLAGGHEAKLAGGKLRVRFDKVLEDSRCPTQVDCVWTGQAQIAVSVTPEASASTVVVFNTNPAPGLTVTSASVGEYQVELQSLDPYPQTPDHIAFEDYRATLIVREG